MANGSRFTLPAYGRNNAGTKYTIMNASGELQGGILGANTVAAASLNEQVLQYVDKTITSAQLLALNATPISVISAPGANKAIVVVQVVAYSAGGTAYAGIATGEDLALRYTDGSGTILTVVETTGWLDQTSAQTRVALSNQSAAGTAKLELTPTANAAVVAHLLSGEITTGDYPIKLRVYYRVVPTVL